jgi:hypothetical protein
VEGESDDLGHSVAARGTELMAQYPDLGRKSPHLRTVQVVSAHQNLSTSDPAAKHINRIKCMPIFSLRLSLLLSILPRSGVI